MTEANDSPNLRRLPCGALDLDFYRDRGRLARGQAFARAWRRLAGRLAPGRRRPEANRLAAARS